MWFIFGLLIGFFIGMCSMAGAWTRSEKKAAKKGFIKLDDDLYILTPVSHVRPRDFMEDMR